MRHFEDIWEQRNRFAVLAISAALVLGIALFDWLTKPYWSLGFLYLFPIMLTAGFLPRWSIVLFAALCAGLSEAFSSLDPSEAWFRLAFVSLALVGCGLFVGELVNNRRLNLEAQERLRILVETSPAAIVTINDRGLIELANRAAADLIAPRDGHLIGHPIAAYLPELHHALRPEEGPQFRTSMQCRGHRDNGESFMADVWFSTYKDSTRPKLAAIIGEITEPQPGNGTNYLESPQRAQLNDRESDVLRFLVQGLSNKEIAVRMDVSESTVKNILQHLFAKSGVRTRSQLVRVALENYRDLL
ncbi:MAG: response regulator transcription factor [Acidobacteriaceae bacterium]|nr:response regulator transcription factor [Acidobacteriaceae bacterium]MBV9781964.1 response regulator transcription factor [Acidobacteriaceae bacterium]